MAARRKRQVLGRRRFVRRADIFQPIVSAIKGATTRPIGLIIFLIVVLITINYLSKTNNNWILTFITKLVQNETWKWLGEWLNNRKLNIVHALWLLATCFLATRAEQAVVAATLLCGITLVCKTTDNTDALLQCISTYFIFAFRKPMYRVGAICATALLVVYGQVYKQFSLG